MSTAVLVDEAFAELTRSKMAPHVRTGVVCVDSALAREWLSDKYYPGQRPLNQPRVQLYRTEMNQDVWRVSDLRFVELPDGTRYLMNGYTRLAALLQYPKSLFFTATMIDVADIEEAAVEYATLDAHRARQTKDQLKGHNLDEIVGFGLSDQDKVARTSGIIASGFGLSSSLRFSRTSEFRVPYLLEWAPYARTIFEVTRAGYPNTPVLTRIYNAPIFAVALVTARFQPIKAQQFWGTIAADDGLRRGQPERLLRDFLATLSTNTVREYPSMSRRVASCWNAYFEGRPLTNLKRGTPLEGDFAPMRLLGTPYTGRRTLVLYGNGAWIPGTEPAELRPEVIYRYFGRRTVNEVVDEVPTNGELVAD